MEIFIFDSTLKTGITLVDEQHKKLLEVANVFFIACEHDHAAENAPEALSFLEQYIQYHYGAEEAYMVDSKYPKYREHQAEHNYFATQLKFQAVRLQESGFSENSVNDFAEFFKGGIINHMLKDDFDFATYYRSVNPEPESE